MKMRCFYLFAILSIIFSSCALLQPPRQPSFNRDEVVIWNENRKLTWDDFQAAPILGVNQSTEILVQMPSSFVKSTLFSPVVTTVECFFDKKRSWVNKAFATKVTLQYNQTIFGIYELYARKLRKKFSETNFGVADPYGVFNGIVNEQRDQLMEEIKNYRTATSSGQDEKAIIIWNGSIAEQLKALEQFKSQ